MLMFAVSPINVVETAALAASLDSTVPVDGEPPAWAEVMSSTLT